MADSGTYDQATLLRRQKIADAMLEDSRKTKPIRHWAEGLSQVADAGAAGYFSNKVDQEGKSLRAADAAALASLLGGGTPAPAAAPAAVPATPAVAPAPGMAVADAMTDKSLPRGFRNQNPGNIEDGPFARSQPGYAGSDGRFAKFASMEQGTGAMGSLLDSYGRKGINTVGGIINRWAPASDGNNVSAYAQAVAKAAGVDPTAPIDMANPELKQKIIAAMAQHENGRPLPQAPVAQAMAPPQMPAAQPAASGGLLANATPQQRAIIAAGMGASEGSPARAIAMSMMTQLMKPQGYERLNDSTLYDPRTGKTLSVPEAEKSIPLGKDQRLVKDGKVIVDQQPDKAVKITLGNGQEVTAIQNPDGSFRLPEVKGAANMAPKLSEGERDQIIKDEDTRAAGESALSAIKEARKLNDKAFSGAAAQGRAWIARNSPVDLGIVSGGLSKEGGKATTQLDNLLTEQALGSMKAIFGGNPTEGERKVLLDLQASSSKSPEERKEILDRAEKLMQRRIQMSGERAKTIREGSYFKPGGGPSGETASDALKQKYGLD